MGTTHTQNTGESQLGDFSDKNGQTRRGGLTEVMRTSPAKTVEWHA